MEPHRLVYHADSSGARKAAAFHASLAAGSLAVGAAAWVLPASMIGSSVGGRLLVGLSLAGAVLFGWIAIRFARRMRSEVPVIVLEPDGIVDNGSAVFSGVGFIRWSDVEEIRVGRYQSLPCVEVVLEDREKFLRRLPWLERPGRSARLGYPAVASRGPLLPAEPQRIVEEMRAYLRAVRGEEVHMAERGPDPPHRQ